MCEGSFVLLVSGLLLISTSLGLLITLVHVAIYGGLFVIERNVAVLVFELILVSAVLVWGLWVCVLCWRRGKREAGSKR